MELPAILDLNIFHPNGCTLTSLKIIKIIPKKNLAFYLLAELTKIFLMTISFSFRKGLSSFCRYFCREKYILGYFVVQGTVAQLLRHWSNSRQKTQIESCTCVTSSTSLLYSTPRVSGGSTSVMTGNSPTSDPPAIRKLKTPSSLVTNVT